MAILDWSREFPRIGPLPLAILLVVASVGYAIVNSRSAGLSHVPGPFIARYTDWYGLVMKWKLGLKGDWLMPLHEKYGDVVRIGPHCVSVADPAAIRTIYSTKARLGKSHRWTVFRPSGINEPYGVMLDMSAHGAHRKLVAGAYANSSLHRYEPTVDHGIRDVLAALEKQRGDGTVEIDVSRWAYYYAYDLIGGVTFGGPIGFVEQGRDVRFLITTQLYMVHYFRTLTQMPFLRFFGISSPLFGVLGVNKKLSFYAYAEEQVEKRLADPTASLKGEKMGDMLSYFMSAGEKNPDLMTRNEITTNCFVNMGAGALSQSKVIEEILRYVVKHPEAQDAMYKEITSRNLSLPVANKDAQSMPYLNAVVREGLRLHHSGFSMISGRNTPPQGLTLPNGVHLPAGVEVGMEPRVLGTREDTYQEKPLEFRPERWLPYPGEDEKVYQARRVAMEHTDLSFGYGASACAGRNVAMMSIHKFLANLIATYKITPSREAGSAGYLSVPCILERRDSV